MLLKSKTAGKVSGTGTITLDTGILGGVLISTDGTNAAAVVIQKTNSSGEKVLDVSTKQPLWVGAPMDVGATMYYDISGTGASAQLYEYVP